MIDLTGKTVLLTGASSGIGFETARALGRSGAHVVAHYSSHEAGALEATAEIPNDHKILLRADFTQADSARSLWREALAWRGRIDVVVCNAAVMPQAAINGSDQEWNNAWSNALEINVVQPAHLIREAVK
jgi:NAD(P)-dependent dehydrogenase (short-subunit alcohol dehydrogenase family)